MDAEAAVKKLAKLPGNTICPNCGTQKKFGFGTVCIKYLTFVSFVYSTVLNSIARNGLLWIVGSCGLFYETLTAVHYYSPNVTHYRSATNARAVIKPFHTGANP